MERSTSNIVCGWSVLLWKLTLLYLVHDPSSNTCFINWKMSCVGILLNLDRSLCGNTSFCNMHCYEVKFKLYVVLLYYFCINLFCVKISWNYVLRVRRLALFVHAFMALAFLVDRVMAIPATVAYFTTYDILKYKFGYRENDPSTKYMPVFAGMISRSTCRKNWLKTSSCKTRPF